MKRCPTCQRSYTDDSLIFCLEDGAMLVAAGASDPMASTLLDSPPKTGGGDRSAATEVFHAERTANNPASLTRSWGTPNVSQPVPQSREARGYSGQPSGVPFSAQPAQAPQKRSWLAVTSLIIGIVTSLLMFIVFLGAGLKVSNEFVGFSFILAMFTSILGIVFGVIAFGIALKNPDRFGGKVVALIGLFLNLLPFLFLLLMLVVGIAVNSK